MATARFRCAKVPASRESFRGTDGGSETLGDDDDDLRQRIADLKVMHRDMDDAIARMLEAPYVDELQMRRMKRRKLILKDTIAHLESSLIPDLDA